MAFWKQQELGQPPAPAPKGKQEAKNLPPEPSPIPSDVAEDNPVLAGDTGGRDKSPADSESSVFDDSSPLGIMGGFAESPGANYRPIASYRSRSGTVSGGAAEAPGTNYRPVVSYRSGSGTVSGGARGSPGRQIRSRGLVQGRDRHRIGRPRASAGRKYGPVVSYKGETGTESEGPAQAPGAKYGPVASAAGTGSGSWSSAQTESSDVEDVPGAGIAEPIPGGPAVRNETKVKYLGTEEARAEFELKVSGSVTQGGQPYDTSAMYSKFKGDGFGIYVMGRDGRFYSTSHKIGLFHHSSFLAGDSVAGAGEIQVVGGTVQYITNKSGHYTPGDKELSQTLHALQGASGFSSAKLARLQGFGFGSQDPYPGGAVGFLKDHPLGGGNKDVIDYDLAHMAGSLYGEEITSVDTVRSLLRLYVGDAQKGALKKFNKPNWRFGSTFEDIKRLVLLEFGWSEADVTTYRAVLENWNNDRPIRQFQGAPPLPSGSLQTMSSSLSSAVSSPVSASTGAASVESDGRDYDAELEELLKSNPSPDWSALGLTMTSFGWGIQRGVVSWEASTKAKVWLLKGEKTVDQLD